MGRKTLFPGKLRGMPLSVTLTPRHWAILNRAAVRLGITKADVIGALLDQHGKTLRLREK
ncbi:MAG: hypothetical protein A3H96_09445 [Acidobacteria bacterium RIFCSPLOWO2_02_FULL_67_36]|nr:MAG: hypothetical protein A3H96_09445 [Acidobacteria bacterium RIFCSPLOWO2_02_FULL_67_36]OFW25003.1 MAG: hypothetical protein A3G21_16295 [Acidobacteria bacterium RIFCSPLOWO2_12_FULL_66_21]